jgi:hypothetical protein
MTRPKAGLAGTMLLLVPGVALAQATPAAPSTACALLAQGASNGAQARIASDNAQIQPPRSVTTLSCLDNFFNGTGLNLITNLLDPSKLASAVEGQICAAVKSEWTSLTGGAQCGLTVTGFNLGFGGLGGGSFCPKLSFGGGGPPVGSIGLGGTGGLNAGGSPTVPTGYSIPTISGLW